jgi:CHAD domain-containing protein
MMIAPVRHRAAVLADDRFADLLLASFDQRWEKYRRELKRCQKKCSEKAVHDLRVATRRLISTIDVISSAVDDNRLVKFRQVLRKRFKESGPLRDVQVHLLRLEKVRDTYPELEQFYTLLLLRERRLLKNIERQMQKARIGLLEQRVREVRALLPRLLEGGETRSAVKAAAIGTVAAGFLRSASLLRRVDPADSRTIHRLRISFKKFRYGVEALQHVLPGVTIPMLKAMNRYQVRMGDIQDLEVFSASFRRYLSKVKRVERINFLPFQQELARGHHALVQEFLAGAGELNGFWTLRGSANDAQKMSASIHKASLN